MIAKTLYLLRHAHTVKGDAITPDHERALSAGGLEECALIGKWLKDSGLSIDYVLASDALRTRETCREIAKIVSLPKAEFTSLLYLASAGKIMNQVNKLPNSANSALIIGHNPGFYEFADRLLLEEATNPENADGFATCGLFIAELPVSSWDLASFGIGRFKHYITPASL